MALREPLERCLILNERNENETKTGENANAEPVALVALHGETIVTSLKLPPGHGAARRYL